VCSKALGELLTEQTNPASQRLDALPTEQILRLINDEDSRVAEAVAREIPAIGKTVEAVISAFTAGGRLFYSGAGTSGRLGVLDAVECPPTFNTPPELIRGIIAGGFDALHNASEASEDDPQAGAQDLVRGGFSPRDVLIGITSSGRTPYVLGAVAEARTMGAVTAGISCTPDSELARAVDIPITPLTGPEIIAGSTRMKAGTATKLVLNMISTAVMIRLGRVYGNLMVNVQPRSSKLKDRAIRIIAGVLPVPVDRAAELLTASGDQVKVAIVMGKLGVDCRRATELLQSAGGRVSEALGRG
jgi:N-acetylmuramic acid 6-phosphate etherase